MINEAIDENISKYLSINYSLNQNYLEMIQKRERILNRCQKIGVDIKNVVRKD